MKEITVGIVRINNGCALDDDIDEIGFHLILMLRGGIIGEANVVKTCSVEENQCQIEEKLRRWADSHRICLILTVGGLGSGCGYVVLRATRSVVEKEIPGIVKLMQPFQSNVACGIRGNSLILNLPDNEVVSRRSFRSIAQTVLQTLFLFCDSEQFPLELDIAETAQQRGFIQLQHAVAEKYIMERSANTRKEICVETNNALGFVLTKDAASNHDVPSFDISSVDGFALLSSDGDRKRELIGTVQIGDIPTVRVTSGTCVRVHVGAAVPAEADVVVKIENANVRSCTSNEPQYIEFPTITDECNSNIIKKGSLNVSLKEGTLLNDFLVRQLDNASVACVTVYKKPVVAAISSFPDSHKKLVISQVQYKGFVCRDLGCVHNDGNLWYKKLKKAFNLADVVVTLGIGPENCIFNVLRSDFHCNIFYERIHEVFFSGVSVKKEQKLWFGFTNYSAEVAQQFLLPALYCISGRIYTPPHCERRRRERRDREQNTRETEVSRGESENDSQDSVDMPQETENLYITCEGHTEADNTSGERSNQRRNRNLASSVTVIVNSG